MNEDDLHRLIERWEALADEAREQTRLTHASDSVAGLPSIRA